VAQTQWMAVDWGTSNVRAWGLGPDGAQTFAAESDRGMGRITRADYPAVLSDLIGGRFAAGDIIVCGMAGARQGWIEAPYLELPADLHTLTTGAVTPSDGLAGLRVRILPGICQRGGSEDVMRGEETQLLGLLGLRPGFEGTVILPGTHSKWVTIEGGRVARFASAMTGELFDLLSKHSVLRHTVGSGGDGAEASAGRAEGVVAGLDDPQLLTSLLFRARAAALLSGKTPDWCAGYLSGLLIATEIAGHRAWLRGGLVPLIGSAGLCALYAQVLDRMGAESLVIPAADATMAGLRQARSQLA